jgi:AcrR family transcriptional regulator
VGESALRDAPMQLLDQRAAGRERFPGQLADRLHLAPAHWRPPLQRLDDSVAQYPALALVVSRASWHARDVTSPQSAGAPPSRPGPADALALARRWFLACRRIDMSALAGELGVNRVTLYRWFGSRDRLLVEVLWSLTRQALDGLEASVPERGAARVVAVALGLLDVAITNPGMRRWLTDEGEHAMRVLTRHETDFQPRLIAAIEALVCQERDAGRLQLAVDAHELAYVLVRVLESYAYLDLITGERPQTERAAPILRMLLRVG